uniref:BPL/LPL catalytic domain-containing protein n=1 Tax=Rhabditophanes sp. KR3021 TaxID=114890 RepID=A0AC35U732_9BILA
MLPTKANSEICKAIHLQSSALPPSPWGSLRSLKQPSQRPPIPKTAPNTPKHITYRSSQLTSVRQASMPRSNRSASVNESRFSVTPVTFSTNSRAVVVSISRYTVLSPRNQSSNYPQQFRARSFSASSKAEDSAIINNNIIQASLFKNKINNKEIETILSMQASPTKNWKSNMPQPNGLANIEESNDIPMVELRKAEVEPGHFLDIKRRSRHASIQIGEMSGLTSDAVPPSFEELSQRRRSLSPRLIAHRNYNLTELLDRQLPEICAKSLFRVNPNTPRRRFCDSPLPCIEDEDCSGGSSSKKAIKNLPKFEPKRIKPRTNTKPPQIAVYAGDDAILYGKVKETVCSILPRSTYTIYHLTNDEMKSDHWIDKSTCCVLICDTNTLDANCWTKLQLYFTQTGKVIFLCQNSILDNFKNCKSWSGKEKWTKRLLGKKGLSRSINKEFDSFLKKCHKHFRTNDEINDTFTAYDSACGYNYSVVFKKDKGAPLLLFMESSSSNAIALFSDTTTEELIEARNSNVLKDLLRKADIITDGDKPIPKVVNITTGYLICKEDKRLLKLHGLKFNQKMGNNPSIIFFSCIDGKEINLPNHEDDCIMVKAVNRNHKIPKFDLNAYFRRLKTKTLGHAILHTDVSKSVMKVSNTITKELVTCDGIVVIANTQTEGYGRNRSEWLSPRGSALFSFDFNIPINSNLGQKIGFLQHIMAVATVDAIHTIVTLQDFPVKIKWPNDIYFDRSFKVGGVFSETCIYGDVYKCVIGVGINILNPKPTVCLNDMLPKDYGSQLNIAEVIAEILNKFEFHVVMFEKRGYQAFLKEYIYFWLHTDEEVTIEGKSRLPKDAQQCIIKGIDQHGLLEVKNKKSGETFSVDSDGNSFDMLKGLIKIKYAN